MQEVLVLLESQQTAARENDSQWTYWQRRTGNEIANELYKEADYVNALEIYKSLANLNNAPSWKLPVWYQMGLVYERLLQPQKATEMYDRILASEKELGPEAANPSLAAVIEMARWRKNHLQWQIQAEKTKEQLSVMLHPARSPRPQ
jgi:tetratricopeptide (TPR) repeat protein